MPSSEYLNISEIVIFSISMSLQLSKNNFYLLAEISLSSPL